MDGKLVIKELQQIASVPNMFDERILLHIQESMAVDVLRMHRQEFADLISRQERDKVSPEQAERERAELFSSRLQNEYRNRAHNGGGFSLPIYVEAAENFYRMEIARHLLSVKNYVVIGKAVAESYHINSALELRRTDPTVSDMAHRVADGLNGINESLEKLTRVKNQAAKAVAMHLQQEISDVMGGFHDDQFAQSLIKEATTLADGKRYLARMERQQPEAARQPAVAN